MLSAADIDFMMRRGTLKMFYRITNKEKIARGIIFILSANEKTNFTKTRNVKIAFLLLPLLSGFDLFMNSLKLWLPS